MGKKTYHIVDPETGEVVEESRDLYSDPPEAQLDTGKKPLIQFRQAYRESSTIGKVGLVLFMIGIVCMPLTFICLFFDVFFSETIVSFWGIATIICCVSSVICLLLCGIGIDK